jgi:major membrane immunogen (membrane-anchored lipoprotein)
MKKYLVFGLVAMAIFLVGCEKIAESNYKAGTYMGSHEYVSFGKSYVTTAVVYIDDAGQIKSVYLDATYEKDGVYTTKKTLGDAYGMIVASPIEKEWYEQAAVLEAYIVLNQTVDVELGEDGKTDAISGVTMRMDYYKSAVLNALEQAKKD